MQLNTDTSLNNNHIPIITFPTPDNQTILLFFLSLLNITLYWHSFVNLKQILRFNQKLLYFFCIKIKLEILFIIQLILFYCSEVIFVKNYLNFKRFLM